MLPYVYLSSLRLQVGIGREGPFGGMCARACAVSSHHVLQCGEHRLRSPCVIVAVSFQAGF